MSTILPKRVFAGHDKPAIRVAPLLLESAALGLTAVYARLTTRPEGLTSAQAATRLAEHGPNVLAQDQRPGFPRLLLRSVVNPLVILLAALAAG